MRRIILFLFLSLLCWGCSTSHYYRLEETGKQIDSAIQDSLFAHTNWGILIESLEDREILYEHNSEKMFIPASNQKIITSAATLKTLGPDYSYNTKLYYSGEIVDSVLFGDLIVQGFGDPTFSSAFYDDPRYIFYCWADTLSALGITKITGNIIGNDNAFDDNGLGMGWSYDDLSYSYAVEVGALQFNDNSLKMQIIPPTNEFESTLIIPEFDSSYFSIFNKTTVSENDSTNLKAERPFGKNEIIISGNLAVNGRVRSRSVSISNPTLFFVTVLKEVFAEKGIIVEGNPLDCDNLEDLNFDTENLGLITIHQSFHLSEIMQIMMKDSNNLYAETIVKSMGWELGGNGTFAEGKKVVENVLADFGIQSETYAYQDGSGLSRYNLFNPKQLVQVLKAMREDKNQIWKDFFPIAGVDGTLENRVIGNEGTVFAKTGTMSNIRCFSGYMATETGEEIVFSILVNGHLLNSKDIDNITDQILNLILENSVKK